MSQEMLLTHHLNEKCFQDRELSKRWRLIKSLQGGRGTEGRWDHEDRETNNGFWLKGRLCSVV